MNRLPRILSTMLITAGVVVLIDVGITLAWKEPMSTVYGSIKQSEAEDSLEALEREFSDLPAIPGPKRAATRARRLSRAFVARAETGEGIGRLEIPAIDLEIVVVEGTDTSSLQKGPGHYPETGFPGAGRTVAIAGHRTTYLAPFRRIDEIEEGDEIVLTMPYATFTYEVEGQRVVDPSQVGVVRDVGYERLVLTACHPLYSAAERWTVRARLSGVGNPAGAR